MLVSWNGKDEETLNHMPRLQVVLHDYFQGRLGRKEFHKDPVSSLEAFEQGVVEAFNAVQARLMELGKILPAGGESGRPPVIGN